MKRNIILVFIIVVVFFLVGGFWFLRSRMAKAPLPTPEPEGVLIETTLEERPYVTLTPSDDGHWLTIDISRIKEAETLEYELLYNTVTGATQGSINTVKLEGKSSYSKKILLGSESRGHYKYDEGVTQGSLTVRLRGGRGTKKFVIDFHLQQGGEELTSIDGNFSLEGTFPKTTFYLTMPTVGLPGDFEGEVILGPYGVFTSGSKTVKNGVVSLELSEESEEANLFSWSETGWEEEKAEIEDKTLSAIVSSLATFIVTSE